MAGKTNPAPPTDEWDVKIKNKKSFTKPLDKHQILWYNKDVPRDEGNKKSSPQGKKTLDIFHKMW